MFFRWSISPTTSKTTRKSSATEKRTPARFWEKQEALFLSWFSESGAFGNQRTAFREDQLDLGLKLEDFTQNIFTPPEEEEYAPVDTEIVLVLRDERQGVTFGGA